jgi:ABC-type nitrate/sulfonate/bicarbonate transport system substrate-binding protein
MKKRYGFAAALLLSLAFLSSAKEARALEDVTISYSGPSFGFLVPEIARARGFFRERNLDVKFLMTRSEVDRIGIASGNIDFTLRTGGTFVGAARGLPVRVVFIASTKPMWALVARKDVGGVADLKGKVIGIGGFGGANHLTAKAIFKQHGLDPERDVIYKIITGAHLPAIQSGSIDAMLMNYNESVRAKQIGYKALLNAADYYTSITSGVGTSVQRIKEKPDQVKRFLASMTQALKYLRENRAGTLDVAMKWLKMDRGTAEEVYDLSIGGFTADGTVDEEKLKVIADQMLAEADIKAVPVSQLIDLSLLRQALQN